MSDEGLVSQLLIRFEVENFRSVLDPVELSLVAVDRDRPAARDVRSLEASLLTVAGIFGPNASGKSNVLHAFRWLRDAVRSSLRTWDDMIPTDPFAFHEASRSPTSFTLELLINGIRFEYCLDLDAERVHYEALFHYPEKRRRRIFERDGNDLVLQRGLGNIAGTRDLLTSKSLALSIARRFDEPLIVEFADHLLLTGALGHNGSVQARPLRGATPSVLRWFDRAPNHDVLDIFAETEEEIGERETRRAQAVALLRLADLGIADVVISNDEGGVEEGTRAVPVRKQIQLLHRSGSKEVALDLRQESAGTKTWFNLIAPTLEALRRGSILLFDELDASLHPTLSAHLLDLFRDPETNPHGAQLIFTTHDANLLNHLNRDEVWLTEKDDRGATRLGALADFAGERVRRSQNLERAYLDGRFGAIPDVDAYELMKVLGIGA